MAIDVAIIGGGLSGTLTAAHLAKHATKPLEIVIFDPAERLGRGIAYGTTDPGHLLNVRASGMSAFPDDPDHFTRYLSRQGGGQTDRTTFAPRMVYGEYVEAVLTEGLENSNVRFRHVRSGITELGPGFSMRDESGRLFEANSVVLALGNLRPGTPPFLASVANHSHVATNPWERPTGWVDQTSRVLIVGTGLTMIDVLVTLRREGHQGAVFAVSRHGLLPRVHADPRATEPRTPEPNSPRQLLRQVRSRADELGDWRPAIDELRAATPTLWTGFAPSERRQFLRHLQTLWDVHRHRVAPEIHRVAEELQTTGRLCVQPGRIDSIRADGDQFAIRIRLRGSGEIAETTCDRIINCTGPSGNWRREGGPLIQSLLTQGLANLDPLEMGIDVDINGQVTGTPGLYSLGPPTRGCRWETTAGPEIRVQAAAIAAKLA